MDAYTIVRHQRHEQFEPSEESAAPGVALARTRARMCRYMTVCSIELDEYVRLIFRTLLRRSVGRCLLSLFPLTRIYFKLAV